MSDERFVETFNQHIAECSDKTARKLRSAASK
jgi:hypothetical protein